MQYEDNTNHTYEGFTDKDQCQIVSIHTLLERPLGIGDDADFLDNTLLRQRLISKKKNTLTFVAADLNLLYLKVQNDSGAYVSPTTKKHLAEPPVQWVYLLFLFLAAKAYLF